MGYRVGVDIGGTFIDFCLFDEDSSALHTLKVLSHPGRAGRRGSAGARLRSSAASRFPSRHLLASPMARPSASTPSSSARARTSPDHDRGFEDVIELARLRMPDPIRLFSRRPPPLVPRDRVIG
jgi:N-methylhydantoinase A